jgi:peptidyl-prolyl cis-trans isomerase SurA
MKFIIIKKLTFLLINLLLISSLAYATTESLDGIAAKVNEDIITINQLNQQVTIAKQQLTSQHIELPTEKVLKKQVLDMMITQILQLQVAKRVDLTVTDKQVKEALANIATSQNTMPQGPLPKPSLGW